LWKEEYRATKKGMKLSAKQKASGRKRQDEKETNDKGKYVS
jgi:hypothetical protein